MKLINELIKIVLDNDYKFTNNPFEAIYILPNGMMIDGGFCDGIRGEDHNMIEIAYKDINRYSPNFWNIVHDDYQLIRLVPETKYALIKKGQQLTEKQKEILNVLNYKIEEY